MTKDQKQVVCALAVFVGVKVLVYAGIVYAAKVARELR